MTTTSKKKSKTKLKTVISVVLDETGSMYGLKADTIGGINNYFQEIEKTDPDALVALMQFSAIDTPDNYFRVQFSGVKVTEVEPRTEANYNPSGGTPLLDAIGKAIIETETQKADRYLVLIITDGYENSSVEWTTEAIRKLITDKEATGEWTFVYLGANQDAFTVGGAMGMSRGSTMSTVATSGGTKTQYEGTTAASVNYLTSTTTGTKSFFADAGQTEEDYKDKTKTNKMWEKEES